MRKACLFDLYIKYYYTCSAAKAVVHFSPTISPTPPACSLTECHPSHPPPSSGEPILLSPFSGPFFRFLSPCLSVRCRRGAYGTSLTGAAFRESKVVVCSGQCTRDSVVDPSPWSGAGRGVTLRDAGQFGTVMFGGRSFTSVRSLFLCSSLLLYCYHVRQAFDSSRLQSAV